MRTQGGKGVGSRTNYWSSLDSSAFVFWRRCRRKVTTMHTRGAISIALVGGRLSYEMPRWACWMTGKWMDFRDDGLLSWLIAMWSFLMRSAAAERGRFMFGRIYEDLGREVRRSWRSWTADVRKGGKMVNLRRCRDILVKRKCCCSTML